MIIRYVNILRYIKGNVRGNQNEITKIVGKRLTSTHARIVMTENLIYVHTNSQSTLISPLNMFENAKDHQQMKKQFVLLNSKIPGFDIPIHNENILKQAGYEQC